MVPVYRVGCIVYASTSNIEVRWLEATGEKQEQCGDDRRIEILLFCGCIMMHSSLVLI